jgi:hypothetical protein
MRIYNGKTITKKYINQVLRTQDSTQVYRLVHHIYGKVTSEMVYNFVRENAPTQKVFNSAYNIAHNNKHDMTRLAAETTSNVFPKSRIIAYLKEQIKDTDSPYVKRPILGQTGLYFCSPLYGHRDYNKTRVCDIKGNERFCELVIRYADKFFNT